MDIRLYLRVIRRNLIAIVAVVLLGGAIGLGVSLIQPPKYESVAKVFVSTGSAANATDLNQGGTYTQQVVKSYADVATTPYVLNPVIKQLRLQTDWQTLADQVTADAPLDTVVIQITVRDTSPAVAAKIANSITTRLTTAVIGLSPDSSATNAIKVTRIQSAESDNSPVSPNILLNVAAGLAIGLIVGLIFSGARATLDTRVRSMADLERLTHLPVLGRIPFSPNVPSNPLIMQADSTGIGAEAFRTLRANLQFFDFDSTSRTFVITSSIAGEGKSTCAANLALAIASSGNTVLLVDADLRRPRVASYFQIEGSIGLTDVLIGNATLKEASQQWGMSSLHILPAGRIPPNPSELLISDSMTDLLAEFVEAFEYVILDSPPLLPASDAAVLARKSAGAILVAAAGIVRSPQVRTSLMSLEQVGARTFGLVGSMLPTRGADAYGYGYGYGYGYASHLPAQDKRGADA